MKNCYLIIVLFSFTSFFAQTLDRELEDVVAAERKSASKRMNIVANPNTGDYDVLYHRLKFDVDPSIYFISGEVTTKFKSKQSMNSVTFDLSNDLEVSSVKQRGNILTFTRSDNNELIINLPITQNINVIDSVSITYSGVPPITGFGAFSTEEHNNTPVLWTLSEPFGAMEWWPCKQDLNDKIENIDVYITAPTQYVSVSNGIEKNKTVNANGTSTTHFKHAYPIPAYLIAIAVSNYQIHNQQGGLGTVASPFFPIVNYLYPETATNNIASMAITPSIINFYESKFGDYPFRNEKYGHCQFGWGGGMEHTTVSFMTANYSGRYSRSLIAHEMAHQWFGDKVTCGDWKDIWLNEGFATYLASMVIEFLDGNTAFVTNKTNMINFITQEPDGAVYLTDERANVVNEIFSSRLSYNKGAMVLNMLRFKLGDTNFFQALRNYLNDPLLAYGYAKTPNLQAHLEATSGLNLTEFFNDWIYNQGYPIYDIAVNTINSGQVKITINQIQSDASVSFFEMPVPIRLIGTNGQQQDIVLENTTNGQQFIVNVPFTVTSLILNTNKDILTSNEGSVTLAKTNFELDAAIAISPNPANSILTIETSSLVELKNVLVYNALGQKVGEFNSKTISVSTLPDGIYSLKIITSEGTVLKKFIKK